MKGELAGAFSELLSDIGAHTGARVAATRLASSDHWKAVAHQTYRERPYLFLGLAAGLGFYLGTKIWPRLPEPVGP